MDEIRVFAEWKEPSFEELRSMRSSVNGEPLYNPIEDLFEELIILIEAFLISLPIALIILLS